MLKENEKINQENIKIFKRYNITISGESIYKCCLCGRKISIDGSTSNEGDRLICMGCAYKNFTTTKQAMEWIRRLK